MSGLHADPQVATSFTIVAVGCLGRWGQHTDTPAPTPARASSPCDEETRPGLLSWETGCPQSLVQRAAAPLGPAGHARPLRACAHCTLLCQALQGETVSLHGTSVELQPSTAPAPAPGSGASPTAPSCSAAPAAAPEFAQQRSPRPAALPLPCPARPPGLSSPSSAATARGAPSQAPLRSAPAASTSANPGSCRPHVRSTEPAATPSVAPAPSRSVRQAPGLPVRRGSASLLPAGCSCPGLRPRPRSLRPLCSDAGVSRAPGPWGHMGENAARTRVWYSPQVRPQASCGPKETPGSRRCRGLCPASRPTAGRPRGCPGRPPPRPPTSGPPSWHRTQERPGECQVGWAPAGARGPPECPLLLLTETCLPSALGTPVGRSPRRPTPQPLACRGLTRRLLGPNRGVQRQNPPER